MVNRKPRHNVSDWSNKWMNWHWIDCSLKPISHVRLTPCGYLRLGTKCRIAGKRTWIAAGSRRIPRIYATNRRERNNFEPVKKKKKKKKNRSLIAVILQLFPRQFAEKRTNPQYTAHTRRGFLFISRKICFGRSKPRIAASIAVFCEHISQSLANVTAYKRIDVCWH